MGYWMHFFDTGKKPLTERSIRTALRRIDPKFGYDAGQLTYDGEDFAQLDLSTSGDGIFDEELEAFRTEVAAVRDTKKNAAAKAQVLATLEATRQTLAVRVGGHDDALDLLDVLWDWLFDHRTGLLHAGGEGFYLGDDLILTLK